jgi:hypothetical protein
MVIPVMDHIDSFFATAATTVGPDAAEEEGEDTSACGASSNPTTNSTCQTGATSANITAAPARLSLSASKPSARHSGLSTATKPSARCSGSSVTAVTHSSSSDTHSSSPTTLAASSSTSHLAMTSDPAPPTYHKAIRAAMTIAKKTLNHYYAKTNDAALYHIAMGTFLPLCIHFHISHGPLVVLNPSYKLEYFEDAGWEDDWIVAARELVEKKWVEKYQCREVEEMSQGPNKHSNASRVSTHFIQRVFANTITGKI